MQRFTDDWEGISSKVDKSSYPALPKAFPHTICSTMPLFPRINVSPHHCFPSPKIYLYHLFGNPESVYTSVNPFTILSCLPKLTLTLTLTNHNVGTKETVSLAPDLLSCSCFKFLHIIPFFSVTEKRNLPSSFSSTSQYCRRNKTNNKKITTNLSSVEI